MPIYQHETLEVVPGKMREYFEGIIRICVPEVCEPRGMKMVGFFQTDGGTGRWPEAVAIWEIADWDAYAQKKGTGAAHSGLNRWQAHAIQWRTGGFDRILVPVSFSPRPPVYPGRKSSGAIIIQQTMEVQPGRVPAYLQFMQNVVLPRAQKGGFTLEAFWRSAFRPLELLALWSVKDWALWASQRQEMFQRPDDTSGPALLGDAWLYLSAFEEMVLVPAPFSPLGGGGPDYVITH